MKKHHLTVLLSAVAIPGALHGQVATTTSSARLTTTADATTPVIVKVDGSRVIDAAGTPLGRIENIVLSPVGCAEAAVLTAANGRLIPIPWTLVRVTGDTRAVGTQPGANLVFTVQTEQARLAQAPSFTRSQWPDMSNNQWLQGSITYFGSTAAAGAGGSITNTVTGTGASGVTVTGGGTNAAGSTAVGAGAQGVIGGTATGAGSQDRFGGTATSVPTNSTGATLPPTGRPNPSRPDFDQPNTPPATPDIPPGPPENRRVPDNTRPTPPAPAPATPPTTPPRSSPSTQP